MTVCNCVLPSIGLMCDRCRIASGVWGDNRPGWSLPQLDEDELLALREYDQFRSPLKEVMVERDGHFVVPAEYRWWDIIPAMRPEDV